MSDAKLNRSAYLSRNVGEYPDTMEVLGNSYEKVDDLRYGTNPHQTAAYYRPAGANTPIGDMAVLKNGKSGLSQTNLEDISYALNIVKFFDRPACACMKHVNPSGAAVSTGDEDIIDVYVKARNADPRAAFGCTAGFNCEVDAETAKEIMGAFTECVVAPSYGPGALEVFNDHETYKNKHIRVLQCGDISALPRYTDDPTASQAATMKVLSDGCIVISDPLLTALKSVDDVKRAVGVSKKNGNVESTAPATDGQIDDLLTAWYINLNVRSNGVVIVKNGVTLAVGTGEQDRVGAVEQAIVKFNDKYEGNETSDGSVMSSDGFFPFPDAVEVAAKAGVTAIISPSGSMKDRAVVIRANELGVALFHAPERIFSHH